MAAIAAKAAKQTKRKRTKRPKNKSWTEKELNAFVSTLTSNEDRDTPWALTLETLALKKSSNEAVFKKILEEFKLQSPDSTGFNIDQLRRKYKWLKNEWRKINKKIRDGSGLAGKDTNSPDWYIMLDPILTEAVDGMLILSSKAADVESEEESNGESSEEDASSDTTSSSIKRASNSKRGRSSSSIKAVDDESEPDNDLAGEDGGFLDGELEDENSAGVENKKSKVKESTDIKASKATKRAPKTQTAAIWQMVKGMEEISKQQEKKSDERLQAMLNMEMKRDEMLIAFQREQAQQNRQHELKLAKLLVQSGMQSGYHTAAAGVSNTPASMYGSNNAMVGHVIGSSYPGHHLDLSPISDQGQNCTSSFEDDPSKVYHKL